ncbi:antibiotic acetyltransferase [Aliivibrio sp. SR45-2]|uniref:antibiotic acetyltransferase n=1 Tax=Aliivibrio sp. SR45-2 TaxID=2760931 RepID=UPI0015FA7EC5|nr:antibiotic acetyltransferase [Aliivibrio sp. SR45-2]MBB1315838.1 antibiotic acetyltransferase [Aliivibrio sp. SR45-2]
MKHSYTLMPIKIFILYIYRKVFTFLKKIEYRDRNIYIPLGSNVDKMSIFEGGNKIGNKTFFKGKLGYGSYIGSNSNISASVGKYCSIADDVKVISGIHPTSKFVSTSPVFYSLQKSTSIKYVTEQKFSEYRKVNDSFDIIIGNDVCISTGVRIIGGLIIGNGAIIGTNAVITRDVEPYSIVGGIPAKVINKRFTDVQIKFLEELKWWDMGEEWLINNVDLFSDIEKLISHHSKLPE